MAIDRTDHDYGDEIPRVSPRFGFDLTPEMGRALAPALELYDTYEDDPIEVVEIAVREELGLAHTLSYNVETDLPLPAGVVRQFARSNGVWEPGFVSPEAWQFEYCEGEMRRLHNLRNSTWDHEAIINDSRLYDPNPWATPYIFKLWDRRVPFPSFIGWLSEHGPTDKFSINDLDPIEGANLFKAVKELTNRRIRSDELESMMVALDLVAEKRVSAEDILEFFVGY
jgi:hypothetical protein